MDLALRRTGIGRVWTLLYLVPSLMTGGLRAASPELDIDWDKDLAFEKDRESYETRLTSIVRHAYATVAADLGPQLKKVSVEVYTPARYASVFGEKQAQLWSAHYQRGRIHVNGGTRLGSGFTGTLVHEMVHAFLDADGTGGSIPIWLNEGLAELYEWREQGMKDLASNQLDELKRAREQRKLIPLPTTRPLSPYQYLQSYGAVFYLAQTYGGEKVGDVMNRILKGETPDKALYGGVGRDVSEVEEDFARWIQRR